MLLSASFFGIWMAYKSAFMLGPMLDAMGREMGASISSMGQLAGLAFIPWAISAPLIGPVSDRYGRKTILLTGLTGLSLANLASAAAPSYSALALCRLLTGICGFVPAIFIAALGDRFSGPKRGNAIAIATSGISASLLIGIPCVALITDHAGWRVAFLAVALFGAIPLALTALTPPKGEERRPASHYLGSFTWMRGSSPWFAFAGNGLEKMMITLFLTYVPAFLLHQYRISLSTVGGILTAMAVGTLAGTLTGGPMTGIPSRFRLLVGIATLQGAFLLSLFSFGPPIVLAVAAGFCFSVTSSLSRPTVMDTLSSIAPRHKGTIIGCYATSNQIGNFLGASLGGGAIALAGYPALGIMGLAAGIAGALFYRMLMGSREEG